MDPNPNLGVLLESAAFAKSPTLRKLLEYLWERRDQEVSEFAIAVEALDRREDFDPKLDATVRVNIARLRQKLKEYYETDGADEPVRLSIPLGTHQLVVSHAPEPSVAPGPWLSPRGVAALSVVAALAVLAGWMLRGVADRPAVASVAERPALDPFWRSFLGDVNNVTVVFSTPTFFLWGNGDMRVRVTSVRKFEDFSDSPGLQALGEALGEPTLSQDYSVQSDTRAVADLVEYLAARGVDVDVESSGAFAPSGEHARVIWLGFPNTNPRIRPFLEDSYFETNDGLTFIRNPDPAPGEPELLKRTSFSPERSRAPGLVLMRPGPSKNSRILVLTSQRTHGLTSLLTTPAGLSRIADLTPAPGVESFDLAVEAELNASIVLEFPSAMVRTSH